MHLSQDHLQSLLDEALRRVAAPSGCAIALEGSIAEGFGNPRSDLDFVLIDDSDREFQVVPTLLFLGGHRVEVRIRSAREMRRQAEAVFGLYRQGADGIAQLDEEELDRCQRFVRAMPLRGLPLLESLRAAIPIELLAEVISAWFALQARRDLRCAIAMLALDRHLEAATWAAAALTGAAKSWLAVRGETYLAKKWLALQLERASGPDELKRRILALESPAHARLEPGAYVRAVAGLVPSLGIDGCPLELERLSLRRRPSVTTWQIGSRVHVLREQTDLFALGTAAARIWRALPFGLPLPLALARLGRIDPSAPRLVADLHGLGLVDLEWREAGPITRRGAAGAVPMTNRPILCDNGARLDEERDGPIGLVPMSPKRFAAAGMQLSYVNMVVENSREDALGAMQSAQWRTFERSLRRMIRHTCIALLSAFGVHPLPAREEVHAALFRIPSLPADLRSCLLELDAGLVAEDERAAAALLQRVEEAVARARALTGSTSYPSSFDSARAWQETLDLGYEWVRLGAFVDTEFPLEQARDLIASAGPTPTAAEERKRA